MSDLGRCGDVGDCGGSDMLPPGGGVADRQCGDAIFTNALFRVGRKFGDKGHFVMFQTLSKKIGLIFITVVLL